MRTIRRSLASSLCAAAVLLAGLLASSCDNDYAIFANIQQEKEQVGTAYFKKTMATNAFKLGDYYYASTSKLYRRSTASGATQWDQVSINGSTSYTLRSVVLVNSTISTIYALTGSDSSNVALYSSTDGSNWSEASNIPSKANGYKPRSTSYSYTFCLDALYSANGELYAEATFYDMVNGSSGIGTPYYYLYHLSGSTWNTISNFTDLSSANMIRGVVYDGSKYWFASAKQLYSGSATAATTDEIGNFTSLSSRAIWALSYTGSHLYVSTKTGYLYQDSGSAEQVDTSSRPLTKVISVPYSGGTLILVGTDTDDVDTAAVGYYEGSFGSLVLGSTNHYVASTSAIYSTTVSVFPVENFYYDGDSSSGNLFVCIAPGTTSTSYYGLYESSWNGSSWTGWDAQ
jgi:hypothetical protein